MPSQKPSVPQVAAPWSAQVPCGSAVAVRDVAAGPERRSAARTTGRRRCRPSVQQTPCAQKPDRHSLPSTQAAPGGLEAAGAVDADGGRGAVGVGGAGGLAGARAAAVREARAGVAGVTQVPAPSQVEAAVNGRRCPSGSVAALQVVSSRRSAGRRRASHLPLVPQVAGPGPCTCPAGSSAPVATLVHVAERAGERARLAGAGAGRVAADALRAEVALALGCRPSTSAPLSFSRTSCSSQELGGRHCASGGAGVEARASRCRCRGCRAAVGRDALAGRVARRRRRVDVASVQVSAAHSVPIGYFWQPPSPSHLPLVPQVAAPAGPAHRRADRSLPAATGVHVPGRRRRARSSGTRPCRRCRSRRRRRSGWAGTRRPPRRTGRSAWGRTVPVDAGDARVAVRVGRGSLGARAVAQRNGLAVLDAGRPAGAEPVAGAGRVQRVAGAGRRDATGSRGYFAQPPNAVARAGADRSVAAPWSLQTPRGIGGVRVDRPAGAVAAGQVARDARRPCRRRCSRRRRRRSPRCNRRYGLQRAPGPAFPQLARARVAGVLPVALAPLGAVQTENRCRWPCRTGTGDRASGVTPALQSPAPSQAKAPTRSHRYRCRPDR